MRDHKCQVPTGRAVRLQILDSILDTPRALLRDRFSDRQLCEVEEEALGIEADLKSEGRCRECGHPMPMRQQDAMSLALAELWGA